MRHCHPCWPALPAPSRYTLFFPSSENWTCRYTLAASTRPLSACRRSRFYVEIGVKPIRGRPISAFAVASAIPSPSSPVHAGRQSRRGRPCRCRHPPRRGHPCRCRHPPRGHDAARAMRHVCSASIPHCGGRAEVSAAKLFYASKQIKEVNAMAIRGACMKRLIERGGFQTWTARGRANTADGVSLYLGHRHALAACDGCHWEESGGRRAFLSCPRELSVWGGVHSPSRGFSTTKALACGQVHGVGEGEMGGCRGERAGVTIRSQVARDLTKDKRSISQKRTFSVKTTRSWLMRPNGNLGGIRRASLNSDGIFGQSMVHACFGGKVASNDMKEKNECGRSPSASSLRIPVGLKEFSLQNVRNGWCLLDLRNGRYLPDLRLSRDLRDSSMANECLREPLRRLQANRGLRDARLSDDLKAIGQLRGNEKLKREAGFVMGGGLTWRGNETLPCSMHLEAVNRRSFMTGGNKRLGSSQFRSFSGVQTCEEKECANDGDEIGVEVGIGMEGTGNSDEEEGDRSVAVKEGRDEDVEEPVRLFTMAGTGEGGEGESATMDLEGISGVPLDTEPPLRRSPSSTSSSPPPPHVPVLLKDVVDMFDGRELRVLVDCTLGAGGHASAIIKAHPEIETFIGLDADPVALATAAPVIREAIHSARAQRKGRELGLHSETEGVRLEKDGSGDTNEQKADLELDDAASGGVCKEGWIEEEREGVKVHLIQGNFRDLKGILSGLNLANVADGILLDLGMSSMQVDDPERGFSFLKDGPLDMRMDPLSGYTAEVIVNESSEQELGRIFWTYGEERKWRWLAEKIVQARQKKPITTTKELVEIIGGYRQRGSGKKGAGRGIHPATRVFQALRIAVNDELCALEDVVPAAAGCLSMGGKIGVISFHSLEDRIVKHIFRAAARADYGRADEELFQYTVGRTRWQQSKNDQQLLLGKSPGLHRDWILRPLTKSPIVASDDEKKHNPRSRSAKLRVAQKCPTE